MPLCITEFRYEELVAEERLLFNEVQSLNDKIELWSSQRPGQTRSDSVPPSGSARRFDTSSSNLLPEIIEYDVSHLAVDINHYDVLSSTIAISTGTRWNHRQLGWIWSWDLSSNTKQIQGRSVVLERACVSLERASTLSCPLLVGSR